MAGGTGALGRAISLEFLREGANLVVTYRNNQEWVELKSLAGTDASRLAAYQIDVDDEVAVEALSRNLRGNAAISTSWSTRSAAMWVASSCGN